jgi:hypothetical protein
MTRELNRYALINEHTMTSFGEIALDKENKRRISIGEQVIWLTGTDGRIGIVPKRGVEAKFITGFTKVGFELYIPHKKTLDAWEIARQPIGKLPEDRIILTESRPLAVNALCDLIEGLRTGTFGHAYFSSYGKHKILTFAPNEPPKADYAYGYAYKLGPVSILTDGQTILSTKIKR